jgi:tetratricopeptide (TPR) repeat protein
LTPDSAEALEAAFRAFISGGEAGAALAAALELQQWPDAVDPATVLAAQARFAAGSCAAAVETLAPLVERSPHYVAAQLLLGHCGEELDDLPGAALAYAEIAEEATYAAARLAALGPRARDAAVERIRAWAADGEIDAARRALAELRRWAPRDVETLAVVSALASSLGDRLLELEVVRALVQNGAMDRGTLERQATLELELGDTGVGLQILEDLTREFPGDPVLAESLGRARFAWRLTMLPEPARGLGKSPELNRGQLAALLYWVFPGVRYTRPAEAIIANDILDHPHRTEIVRVVNLGIMEVDRNLHAVRPDAAAMRVDALRGLLRLLERGGARECLDGTTVTPDLSVDSACHLAARCGLVVEPGDCLPQAPLSGSSAMDFAGVASRHLEQD